MRLVVLALAALALAAPASAQGVPPDGPYALRLDDREMDGDAVSLAGLVRGLHVLAPGAEAPEAVVLFAALVADGEVIAVEGGPFLAAPVADGVRPGVTLRDAEIDVADDYAARRRETAYPAEALFPGAADRSASFFPGEMHFPGEMYFPGDMYEPSREDASIRPGRPFVGTMGWASPRGASARDLLDAARRIDARAVERGAPMLILFASHPQERSRTEFVGFVRR